jgi:serine/threonine-protein kinase
MKTCPTCQASHPNSFAVCPQDGTALVEAGGWGDGAVVRGKYRIVSKVGQGGMGAVYKARHLAFDELRALKVMTPELANDELFVKRFKHEAVITRKLQHPNAVRVDDIDETEDGRPFIVMEYIEGRSLKKVIQEEGPLEWPRVCLLSKQVAAGLDAAHRLGMVHRDIKPENIVLVETAEGEQAKVLDFGIAKIRESRLGEGGGMTLTGTGVVIGTPQYMSPEQALGKRGAELDGRSDLYSLGIVMYQMLTADLPFKAETTMEMLLAHLQQTPAVIGLVHPELRVPAPLADLTMKLLEKDPNRRPATGQALIDDLARVEQSIAESPSRVVLPTVVVSPDQGEARTPTPAASFPSSGSAAAGTAPPPAAPFTPPPMAQPPAGLPPPPLAVSAGRVAPPPKQANWGLGVAVLLIVAVLGGGGWYFLGRRASSSAGSVSQPPALNSPAPASGTSTPAGPPAANSGGAAPGTSTPAVPPAEPPGATSATSVSGGTESGRQTSLSRRSEGALKPELGSRRGGQPESVARQRPAPDLRKVKGAITLGDFYLKDGKYDQAIRAYKDGLQIDPTNEELRSRIGKAMTAKAAEDRVLQ